MFNQRRARRNAMLPRQAWLGAIFIWFACVGPCWAIKHNDPAIKGAVAKAIAFLADHKDNRTGGKVLAALTMVKAEQANHPLVQEAIRDVQLYARQYPENNAVYTLGLSIIFLTELPDEIRTPYDSLIDELLATLISVQKSHGGWGYASFGTGDTSMTQYGVLALWSAQMTGHTTPQDSWERVTNWLLRTQAADGAWGYQGVDPGNFDQPAAQTRTTMSMCAAGAGSLYICNDYFGFISPKPVEAEKPADDVPSAMKRIARTKEALRPTTNVSGDRVRQAAVKGDAHIDAGFTVSPKEYPYYYLYALERYKSFQEQALGTVRPEPQWYNQGAEYLLKSQNADGSWGKSDDMEVGVVPNTCFAALFLLRSQQKAIEKHLGGGTLVGGRGLPDKASDLELNNGGLRAKKLKGPLVDIIKRLGDPNDPQFDSVKRTAEEAGLLQDEEHLSELTKQLRELASGKSPEQRAAALLALARTRDLDQVPLLVAALKDSDDEVFLAANEALRFISRRFEGAAYFGLADEETRKKALEEWRAWYKSIRPEAVFED